MTAPGVHIGGNDGPTAFLESFGDHMEAASAPPSLDDVGRSIGIGILGCGAIVQAAHLPAYRQASLSVVAVADRDARCARAVAKRFAIPRWYSSAEDLLADPEVQVVDVAVDPDSQASVARRAIADSRHLLCQKPFSESLETARDLVRLADQAGTVLGVNQQMRWEPLVRGLRACMDADLVGQVYDVLIDVDVLTDWTGWAWMVDRARLEGFYHSIHHLDSVRYLLGEPTALWAALDRVPGQQARGETRATYQLRFPDGISATIRTHHDNRTDQPRAVIRVRGTEGSLDGELGMLYDYPHGRADRISVRTRAGQSATHEFTRRWVPDAFVASMSDVLRAVAQGGAPSASGEDNLLTLELVLAAYESERTGRRVTVGVRGTPHTGRTTS